MSNFETTYNYKDQCSNDNHSADKTKFVCQDGKDKVVVPDFQKTQLYLAALPIAISKPATRTDADQRLFYVISLSMPGGLVGLKEIGDTRFLIISQVGKVERE